MPRSKTDAASGRTAPATAITEGTGELASLPIHPDARLQRKALGAALRDEGFPIADSTLATMAVRGGGPPFQRFGRIPLYTWGTSLMWARGRLSPPLRTTSEADRRAVAHQVP
jgi:hypothetical protein